MCICQLFFLFSASEFACHKSQNHSKWPKHLSWEEQLERVGFIHPGEEKAQASPAAFQYTKGTYQKVGDRVDTKACTDRIGAVVLNGKRVDLD